MHGARVRRRATAVLCCAADPSRAHTARHARTQNAEPERDARDTPRGDARRESRERDGCRNPDDATGTTSIESRIDLIRFDLI